MVRAILAAAALALPAAADTLQCPDADVSVTADDPVLAARICATAARALPRLAACHLPQTAPIAIDVRPGIPGNHLACLAEYNCRTGHIAILAPDALQAALDPQGAFAALEPGALFDSLIVHELTHALQMPPDGNWSLTVAAAEYMAYAMQLDFLPEAERARFLALHAVTPPVELAHLSTLIVEMAPTVFAARVWHHFAAPGNGCDFIARLRDGRESLPDHLP